MRASSVPNSMCYIYCIAINGEVIYVGKTNNPFKRHMAHFSKALWVDPLEWDMHLDSVHVRMYRAMCKGVLPEMKVIDHCDRCDSPDREYYWIKKLSKKYLLCNIQHLMEVNGNDCKPRYFRLRPISLENRTLISKKAKEYRELFFEHYKSAKYSEAA